MIPLFFSKFSDDLKMFLDIVGVITNFSGGGVPRVNWKINNTSRAVVVPYLCNHAEYDKKFNL